MSTIIRKANKRNLALVALLSLAVIGCTGDDDGGNPDTAVIQVDSGTYTYPGTDAGYVVETGSAAQTDAGAQTDSGTDMAPDVCLGSSGQAVELFTPTPYGYVTSMYATDDALYFAATNGGIYRLDDVQGDPTLLADSDAAPDLVVYGDYLYWTLGGGTELLRTPLDSPDLQPETVLENFDGLLSSRPATFRTTHA